MLKLTAVVNKGVNVLRVVVVVVNKGALSVKSLFLQKALS